MTIYSLYVKTHKKTGLKYLGYTSKNPFNYKGSGHHWKRHLHVHGNDVDTIVLRECTNKSEIKEWGLYYSLLYNVVKSENWANEKEECGDGGTSPKRVEQIKQELSEGRHIFQNSDLRQKWLLKQIAEGKHPTQNCSLQRSKTKDRVARGTHPWIQDNYQTDLNYTLLAEGRHPSQKKLECQHCGRIFDSANYGRWHGDNCSSKVL